ncbi:uncharacterized protein LOC122923388 isoform X1 [Bufo gargarizans]|uniref:uncharacterized protein LOC122923388 isoform X1 n=1 Tax=Bufo gargarizans TaxID=30331 RepID=UPI001CF3C78C|nr:uncharacterized protein LOC122923388 isoform X1 [Bufo gargarizans]
MKPRQMSALTTVAAILCALSPVYGDSITVKSEKNLSAAVGRNVTLLCQLMSAKANVIQITWQKESGNFSGPVASTSRVYGPKILGYYSNRAKHSSVDTLNMSAIIISPVTLEDEGCFKCIFNLFPVGASSGTICLDVYEEKISEPTLDVKIIDRPEMLEKLLVITCSGSGLPAPNISWNHSLDLQYEPQTLSIVNSDGTMTVISNLTQTMNETLEGTNVTCIVNHPTLGAEKRLSKLVPYTGIKPQVNCTAKSEGGEAQLTCKISSPMDVVQVTWQKRRGSFFETLVTHSKRFGVKISKPYENRLSVLQTEDPETSSITLSQLEKEDDSCYTAIFNIYPDGSLKGEACPPKLHGIKEVICKSPVDFSVTLDPPQIKIQNSEPNGATIQIGRWINDAISPVCNFHPPRKESMSGEKTEKKKRSVPDQDDLFTIECYASGTQKPTITWSNEGRPISREEKVNTTGDFIIVTSTLLHSWSTLSEGKNVNCTITYHKDDDNVQGDGSAKTDMCQERNPELFIVRGIVPSVIIVLVLVVIYAMCYFSKRKQPYSPKKYDRIEKGDLTPANGSKHKGRKNAGSQGTEQKHRKGPTVKKSEDNSEWNSPNPSSTLINTNEINTTQKSYDNVRTPGTEIKERKGSTVKKNKEIKQRNIADACNTNEVTNETPRSETKQQNSPSGNKKRKSAKRLFN